MVHEHDHGCGCGHHHDEDTEHLHTNKYQQAFAKLYPKFEAEKFHQMCEEYQIPLDKFIKEY